MLNVGKDWGLFFKFSIWEKIRYLIFEVLILYSTKIYYKYKMKKTINFDRNLFQDLLWLRQIFVFLYQCLNTYINESNLYFALCYRQSTLFDFKSEHIAEQMTLLDAELFNNIEIPEVLIWTQEQDEKTSPNLTRFTEHFNKVSFWWVNYFFSVFTIRQLFRTNVLNIYVSSF